MTDELNSWIERLESLRHCNLNPELCTHDASEDGSIRHFDYTSIDLCLDQIIGEMQQELSKHML